MKWASLLYTAARTALAEWLEERARRKAQARFAGDPRSSVYVQCTTCGADVRADAASMRGHRCRT